MVVDCKPVNDISKLSDDNESFHITNLIMDIRSNLNAMFLVIIFYVYNKGKYKTFLGRYNVISINKLRNIRANWITKLGYFLSYWLVALNLLLIVICFPGIQNPGPLMSVMYNNVRGFVPPGSINADVPPLIVDKIQSFQSYMFDKNPSIIVLNET